MKIALISAFSVFMWLATAPTIENQPDHVPKWWSSITAVFGGVKR